MKLSKSLSLKCWKNLKSTEHCKNCWKQNSAIIWTVRDWISFLIRIKGIEIVTLLVIGGMALLETWLVGIKSLRRKPWIIFLLISVIISLIDVFIDLSKSQDNSETFLRLRRLLRPFIFIQSSLRVENTSKYWDFYWDIYRQSSTQIPGYKYSIILSVFL